MPGTWFGMELIQELLTGPRRVFSVGLVDRRALSGETFPALEFSFGSGLLIYHRIFHSGNCSVQSRDFVCILSWGKKLCPSHYSRGQSLMRYFACYSTGSFRGPSIYSESEYVPIG